MKTQTYNPVGVVTNKPISLRLMPEELSENGRIASEAGISRANLARQAYLKGLPLVIEELQPGAENRAA